MALGCDGLHFVRVPDDHVGVRAHSNPPFSGVQVKDLGRIGAGDSDKLVLIHFAGSLKARPSDEDGVP